MFMCCVGRLEVWAVPFWEGSPRGYGSSLVVMSLCLQRSGKSSTTMIGGAESVRFDHINLAGNIVTRIVSSNVPRHCAVPSDAPLAAISSNVTALENVNWADEPRKNQTL